MKANFKHYTLNFKQASGTSRGILKTKTTYFIFLAAADGNSGLGECGLLKGLSADDRPGYEDKLAALCQAINNGEKASLLKEGLEEWPSILAGLEMALLDIDAQDHVLFPSAFTNGQANQAINGLIWMGDESFMKSQIEQRLNEGFSVLKMKIGAIAWPTEKKLLKSIRGSFSASDLELRVDANGAFTPTSAPAILDTLATLEVHSIEQPLKKGQWQEMAYLCEKPALPIALDEELIGLFGANQKEALLQTIKPQYLILKPSFLGGFTASEKWIQLAEEKQIGWWVTSALESNVGLSAIAQWNYTLQNPMPSGLGTGSLYINNFTSPLQIKEGALYYNTRQAWQLEKLKA